MDRSGSAGGKRPFSGTPSTGLELPAAVLRLAGHTTPRPVWQNELGGLTFELALPGRRLFVKWAPRGVALDLGSEAVRLRWAAPYTAVPEVLDGGCDKEGQWLLTAAIDGDSAVSERWRLQPVVAARAVGEGLRAVHEALPVPSCPFNWSAEQRLEEARRLVSTSASAGHVDLGALGVADRWADLAVATWSCEWNYGAGFAPLLLDAYGVEPDQVLRCRKEARLPRIAVQRRSGLTAAWCRRRAPRRRRGRWRR